MAARLDLVPSTTLMLAEHAEICCSSTNCQRRLPVSFEDAREGSMPKVEGWREIVGSFFGKEAIYRLCARCVEQVAVHPAHAGFVAKEGF